MTHLPRIPHDLTAVCPCWECRVERAADEAIATRWPVQIDDLWLVPHHLVVASARTAHPLHETHQIARRRDGEVVHVYRNPGPARPHGDDLAAVARDIWGDDLDPSA